MSPWLLLGRHPPASSRSCPCSVTHLHPGAEEKPGPRGGPEGAGPQPASPHSAWRLPSAQLGSTWDTSGRVFFWPQGSSQLQSQPGQRSNG